MDYYRYPVDKIGITSDYGYRTGEYSGFHYGLDLGWMDYQGENIYSIGQGEVIDKGYTAILGNYIIIKHSNGDTSKYLHMRESTILNIGDIVTMGSFIGYMGTTGSSTGVHLHIGITRNGELIDPKTVLYVYPEQFVSENTKNNYKLLYYDISDIKQVERDNTKDQVLVNATELNIRKGPSTSYDKYSDYAITNGIYNYYDVIQDEIYTWYKIGNEAYIANKDNWLTIYKKSVNEDTSTLQEKISSLEEDIKLKEKIISNLQTQIKEEINYKFSYNVLETGKFKITLNKGETLIIK